MKTNNQSEIDQLNAVYASLSPLQRLQRFYAEFGHKKILVSSSFGTTSAYLLHLISKVNRNQAIHFINTGYLFQETLNYTQALEEKFGLNLKTINPDFHHHQYTTKDKTWEKDTNLCCSVNKVLPFDEVKKNHEIWISGLLGNQNRSRSQRKIFEQVDGMLKFHPAIDMTTEKVFQYIKSHKLPENPLIKKGYESVGCFHCTAKGKGRNGRWKNSKKTECGLHITPTSEQKSLVLT